jgi:hypothetical protein
MQTLEPILAQHPFFAGLKPEYMRLVAGCASNVRYPARTYLIRQGKVALETAAAARGPITMRPSKRARCSAGHGSFHSVAGFSAHGSLSPRGPSPWMVSAYVPKAGKTTIWATNC